MKKFESILLVDDDSTTNYINENLLTKMDIADKIITKSTARSALTYLSQECRFANKFPNLIFLDLKMPNIDGFDFLREFQKICFDIRKDITIIILSSSTHIEDVIKLKNLGNFTYFAKPLTESKIVEVLVNHVGIVDYPKQMA
jgi:response regulator of citrate/malate metabolism